MERRATASNSRDDVVMDAGEQSGSAAESGWSGVSDNSSIDSECTILEASDQDRFDTAYEAFRGSHVNNLMHCYSTRLLGAATRIPMRKNYRGPGLTAVQTWWEQCKEWMEYFKGQSAPGVPDLQSRLQVLRGKEEVARAEVETFMEHCAKRWQTKEGTYQLKRRRLLPDVRRQT